MVVVAERLGDIPQMVLKVYGHCMPDSEDRTAARLIPRGATDKGRTGVITDRHQA